MQTRFTLAVVGLTLGVLWLSQGDAASRKKDGGEIHFTLIPGFPDNECAGPESTKTPKCDTTTFKIEVVQIKTPSGAPACLAYLPYNELTVHVGPKNKGAKVTWDLPPNTKAIGNGMDFTAPSGFRVTHILESQAAVTVKVRSGVIAQALGKKFGHLPKIALNIGGDWYPCGGADPGIIVNAD